MANSKNLSYDEAMAEVERIIASLQSGEEGIDSLADKVARASELLAMCRNRLRKVEGRVNEIFDNKTE